MDAKREENDAKRGVRKGGLGDLLAIAQAVGAKVTDHRKSSDESGR